MEQPSGEFRDYHANTKLEDQNATILIVQGLHGAKTANFYAYTVLKINKIKTRKCLFSK